MKIIEKTSIDNGNNENPLKQITTVKEHGSTMKKNTVQPMAKTKAKDDRPKRASHDEFN